MIAKIKGFECRCQYAGISVDAANNQSFHLKLLQVRMEVSGLESGVAGANEGVIVDRKFREFLGEPSVIIGIAFIPLQGLYEV